jgi:hypothetical protein
VLTNERDLKIVDGLNNVRTVELLPLDDEGVTIERVVGRADKSPLVTILSVPDRFAQCTMGCAHAI